MYQYALERSIVDLGDEDFDTKARHNERSEHGGGSDGKWYLQKLSLEAFGRWENLDLLSGDGVGDGLLVLELSSLRLNLRHTANAPSNGQVGLLVPPVFCEDGAPDGVDDAVYRGE